MTFTFDAYDWINENCCPNEMEADVHYCEECDRRLDFCDQQKARVAVMVTEYCFIRYCLEVLGRQLDIGDLTLERMLSEVDQLAEKSGRPFGQAATETRAMFLDFAKDEKKDDPRGVNGFCALSAYCWEGDWADDIRTKIAILEQNPKVGRQVLKRRAQGKWT